jgi:pimeloyl-ACP methyl ester carboxylesterase
VRLAVAGVGATAAALTAGVAVEKRVIRERRAGATGADQLGGLRGDSHTVVADDGVQLHAEVDEVAPYTGTAATRTGRRARRQPPRPDGVTVVLVHGYALNLDCWHFQRQHLRGRHRLVLYDQRSHGRSTRSDNAHATIDQLGHDLRRVVDELAPEGPLVLVGHSMGGMTVMAFAEHHPEVFAERVVGVALISTSAGGLKTHHLVSRLIPDFVGGQLGQRLVAGLARAPDLVDRVRRPGSNLGFLLADQFAFGDSVPASYVEFVDDMLASTSFEVIAQFFPNFDAFDKFAALDAFTGVPTYIVSGTKDALTAIGHSRKMASRLPDATLVECPGAGHMVILERKDQVNAALDKLLAAATARPQASRVS